MANLLCLTGAIISLSFISEFFKKIGPYAGNFRTMCKVLINKYKASNVVTYNDYLHNTSIVPSWQIKFGDKKNVKGEEVFNFTGRMDPMAGKRPHIVVPLDFWNTYCIIGLVTVDMMCW